MFVGENTMYCLSGQSGQLVDPSDVRDASTGSARMPMIELGDFNRDGMIDMAFATDKGVLNILFNQLDSRSPKADNLCNDIGNTEQIKSDNSIFPKYPFNADDNGVV